MSHRDELVDERSTCTVGKTSETERQNEDERDVTTFIGTDIEFIPRQRKRSNRYISILRIPTNSSKYVSVGYWNLTNKENRNLRYEEIIEEIIEVVYTHNIHELIVYEEETEMEIDNDNHCKLRTSWNAL